MFFPQVSGCCSTRFTNRCAAGGLHAADGVRRWPSWCAETARRVIAPGVSNQDPGLQVGGPLVIAEAGRAIRPINEARQNVRAASIDSA